MKISKGIKEKNIEVGNFFDKYQSRNFLIRNSNVEKKFPIMLLTKKFLD